MVKDKILESIKDLLIEVSKEIKSSEIKDERRWADIGKEIAIRQAYPVIENSITLDAAKRKIQSMLDDTKRAYTDGVYNFQPHYWISIGTIRAYNTILGELKSFEW